MSSKYLFVINTKIASLVSNLVIHHLQLDIRDCYYAVSRDDMHLLSEAMLPDNAIFIDDIDNLLSPCADNFDCYRYTACTQHLIKRFTSAIGTLEYELFIPGLDNFICYALASTVLCKQIHIIEEGFKAYTHTPDAVAYNLDPQLVAAKYQEFFAANPAYHSDNTGVQNFEPINMFDFNKLSVLNFANPEKKQIVFYRLNRQAFNHYEQDNLAYIESIANTPQADEAIKYRFITFDLEQVKQDSYQGPLLQVAQQYQTDLTHFHVLAVDPMYGNEAQFTPQDYEIYANHIKSLLARIQHQYQAEMLFVRFTKGQSKEQRDLVINLLDETDFYFLVLEDDFNLELELALAPQNQFLVHGISSELLIYSQNFQQITCEYIDLVIHDSNWNNYLTSRNYLIKSILSELGAENSRLANSGYAHVFLVTSEVALATTLTLIKQFDIDTSDCYILTDGKNHPKVSSVYNERQVMSIDDFEIIYDHVNSQRKVVHYLDAATYVNGMVNKFINYQNYSFYTDSMDSYLSMQLSSHYRCREVNLIEAGVASAQINNNFGIEKAYSFFNQLTSRFKQQIAQNSPVMTKSIITYCFRLRKYAFTQKAIVAPMMLINLQVKHLRELNLYNQIIVPVDGAERIHLLVIENNQADYPLYQQYLTDYASVLRSLEDRHLNHLYIMLIHPHINVFNQLKNLIIATGIPSSLFYNIDLFSELFYANKQVRVHTMSPRIAALAQFSQQAFTLYQNKIPVEEWENLPALKLRATLTDVILEDLDSLATKAPATDVEFSMDEEELGTPAAAQA